MFRASRRREESGRNARSRLTGGNKTDDNQFGIAVGIIKGEAKAVFNSKDFSVVAYRSARTNIS